jgi:hypothetical protein
MLLSLVIFWKVFFALKVNNHVQNMRIKRIFLLFLCVTCLPASYIMHVPMHDIFDKVLILPV